MLNSVAALLILSLSSQVLARELDLSQDMKIFNYLNQHPDPVPVSDMLSKVENNQAELLKHMKAVISSIAELTQYMKDMKTRDASNVDSAFHMEFERLRSVRSAPSEPKVEDITSTFEKFKDGLNSFVKNVTSSDIYHKLEEFGQDLKTKGKELGEKIQETIQKAKKDSDEKSE